jgi:hypothetical protein
LPNPFPLVSRATTYLGQGRAWGWSNFTRGIATGRMIGVGPFEFTAFNDPVAGPKMLANVLDGVGKYAYTTSKYNRMTVVTFPENAACGMRVPDGHEQGPDIWIFPGENALPLSMCDQLRQITEQKIDSITAQTQEPLVAAFTTTYDVGVKDMQGRRVLVNRMILSAGSGQSIYVDKSGASSLDFMSNDSVVVSMSDTPQTLTVKDLGGDGRSVVLAGKICLDLTKPTLDGLLKPDLIVVSALGAPGEISWVDDSLLAVADGSEGRTPIEIGSGDRSGVWAPTQDQPALDGLVQATDGGWWGSLLRLWRDFLPVTPSRFQKLANATPLQLSLDGTLGEAKETREFEIPSAIAPTPQQVEDVVTGRIASLDPSGASYDASDPTPFQGDPPAPASQDPDIDPEI